MDHNTSGRRYPYLPDYAVHPGTTLLETIEEQGISQKELAQRTGFTEKHVNQIVKGKVPVSPDAALRFEMVTGVPAHMWNNMEAQHKEQLARQAEQTQLEADLNWLQGIPVKELVKRQAISASKDLVTLLKRVLQFFGVASVDAWRAGWSKPEIAFRKSTAHDSADGALAAWLRLGEIKAAARDCQPYDAKRFRNALEDIRSLTVTNPQEFLPQMIELCGKAGVALTLVEEIKGARVGGATKWLTQQKALLCMSFRGQSNDRFWFTFFHESGHILHDSKREVFVDVDYHEDPREHAANTFSRTLLIPAQFEPELPKLKTRAAVLQFASRIGIHPGIVVGRLQWDKILPYTHLNALKVKLGEKPLQ